jgi:hypothetical protein
MVNYTDAAGYPCPDPIVRHAHRHLCWFPSCRFQACLIAQRNAELYGFTAEGEIATPSPRKFPWEQDAA